MCFLKTICENERLAEFSFTFFILKNNLNPKNLNTINHYVICYYKNTNNESLVIPAALNNSSFTDRQMPEEIPHRMKN